MNEHFKLLPQEMQEAITGLGELHNTPDSMAIQCVLGVANLAAQKLWNVDSRVYGIRPVNEFFICMAPTGAMKSTNYREISQGIDQYQQLRQEDLRNDALRYQVEQKAYKKKITDYERALELDPATAILPQAPRPIESAKYTIGKATVNGIIDQLKSQAFVGLFSSEAGEFFNGHSFQNKDAARAIEMSAALTSMWDGHTIDRITGVERTSLSNRRVNMLFLLQTETIQQVLNNPVFSEQGFVHRLLITQSDYYEKQDWEFTPESYQRQQAARTKLTAFNDRILQMMRREVSYLPGKNFELDLPTMRQTDQAHECLGQWRNLNKNAGSGVLRNYQGFAERLHEHALRLAATVAAFRGNDLVKLEDAECACLIMDYYIDQRRQLEVGVSDWNPVRSAGANKMQQWLEEKRWSGSLRELSQSGPTWYRKLNSTQRDEIIADLLKDEIIELVETVAANGRTVSTIKLIK